MQQIHTIPNNYTYSSVDDRDTIVDQSVNQNIWAKGDVKQSFDDSVIASGDGAIAAGDDVDDAITGDGNVVGDGNVTGNGDGNVTGDDNVAGQQQQHRVELVQRGRWRRERGRRGQHRRQHRQLGRGRGRGLLQRLQHQRLVQRGQRRRRRPLQRQRPVRQLDQRPVQRQLDNSDNSINDSGNTDVDVEVEIEKSFNEESDDDFIDVDDSLNDNEVDVHRSTSAARDLSPVELSLDQSIGPVDPKWVRGRSSVLVRPLGSRRSCQRVTNGDLMTALGQLVERALAISRACDRPDLTERLHHTLPAVARPSASGC